MATSIAFLQFLERSPRNSRSNNIYSSALKNFRSFWGVDTGKTVSLLRFSAQAAETGDTGGCDDLVLVSATEATDKVVRAHCMAPSSVRRRLRQCQDVGSSPSQN